jgi:hypothetical protein
MLEVLWSSLSKMLDLLPDERLMDRSYFRWIALLLGHEPDDLV